MIIVNGKEIVWVNGERVEETLIRADAYHSIMVVNLRGKWLRKNEWSEVKVIDGDEIRTVDIIAGG